MTLIKNHIKLWTLTLPLPIIVFLVKSVNFQSN
jgi:hypothetical protein